MAVAKSTGESTPRPSRWRLFVSLFLAFAFVTAGGLWSAAQHATVSPTSGLPLSVDERPAHAAAGVLPPPLTSGLQQPSEPAAMSVSAGSPVTNVTDAVDGNAGGSLESSPAPEEPPTPPPAPARRAMRKAGRGHRIWARVGSIEGEDTDMTREAAAGLRRLVDAFAEDYYAGTNLGRSERETPNRDSRYFTHLSAADVLVTDPQGRAAPEYAAAGETRVDVVFTHVDGTVAGWMDRCRKHYDEAFPGRRFDESRFRDNGELRYAVRSFVRHASHMVRRVVLLVEDARHVERALDNATLQLARERGVELVVVAHGEAFPDASVLPVFNSFAIESVVNRVPGLAPLALYANDDMMIGRKLSWFDVLRPVLVELPEGWTPSGGLDWNGTRRGLAGVPWADGFAMSVMARDAGRRTEVYVELEVIPLVEFQWHPLVAWNNGLNVDLETDLEIDQACGSRSYRANDDEDADYRAYGPEHYSLAKVNRLNMQYIWNHMGMEQTHWNSHNPRLLDRALLSLMLDRDEWDATVPSLLPAGLVRRTRASRFRENANVNPTLDAVWLTAAENRRRQKQLLYLEGHERSLRSVLKCSDCHDTYCVNNVSRRALASAAKFVKHSPDEVHWDVTVAKLFEVVFSQSYNPEYAFEIVGNITHVETKLQEHMARIRLWITINDNYDSSVGSRLPDADMTAFERLLRVASGDPG